MEKRQPETVSKLIWCVIITPWLIFGSIGMYGYIVVPWQVEQGKQEAQKILDFRNNVLSCNELKKLYLEYYPEKYNSVEKHYWYNEVREKLINEKCVDSGALNNIEVIEICSDAHFTSCEISKLKYPQAYKNFNFNDSIMNLNTNDTKQEVAG